MQFDVVWMADAEMTGDGIVATECLLFRAQMIAHFLFARVVNSILMAGNIVGTRENGVAGPPCRGLKKKKI